MIKKNPKEFTLLAVFVVAFIIMSILSPDKFLGQNNLQAMMFQLPEFGIMALAMMVVILTGGINLSITYHASLAGVVMAILLRNLSANGMSDFLSILISIIAALIVAILGGLLNGSVVAFFKVTPILATLGTMILFKGIGLNLTKGYSISGFPESFNFFGNGTIGGIPVAFILLIFLIAATWLLLERTPWGLQVHMLGNNSVAVEYSGINIKKVIFKVYLLSALLCFFATLVMTSRYNSMKPEYGYSYLLRSVLAVVLGGTSINGGYGKVLGTLLSIMIIQVVSSGLNIAGLNQFFIDTIMGLMLILVLAINFISSTYQNKKMIAMRASKN